MGLAFSEQLVLSNVAMSLLTWPMLAEAIGS